MDNDTPPSPTSSSGSDSDAFNTESARVYFGPFKTPERKFIAAAKSLFPPFQPLAARRSPRLSDSRPRSGSPMDTKETEDDIQDIEQVEQLVHDSEEDEQDESGTRTPPPAEDNLQDEPSSALADRVIHALDNPSPPPSPPSTLRIFDPYHANTPEGPTDYHRDLMSLKLNDTSDADSEVLQLVPIGSTPSQSLTPIANNAAEECLIVIDSFPAQSQQTECLEQFSAESSFLRSRPVLSVDDLLSQSPTVFATPPQPRSNAFNPFPENTNTNTTMANEAAMIVDNSESHEGEPAVVITTTSPCPSVIPEAGLSVPPLTAEGPQSTPLRRSTRPRKSVTPMLPTTVNTPVFVAPPSIARTQIKKKALTPNRNDEVVNDSQGEDSDSRESPKPPYAASTVRVRHRSPGKAPLSFRRELGSLSPTSSNVLEKLAFSAPDEPTSSNASNVPTSQAASSSQQPMLSFSVFTPPNEPPSTPARTSGPVRFQSPAKAVGSTKYQIKSSMLGDPTSTPARRVPIQEGIAQGYVSPEKLPHLGFSTASTPLPSQATPARRVPVADSAAPALMKSTNLRPASPLKKFFGQREPSIEPMQRSGSSLKGKERAAQVPEVRPKSTTKLPFPLVPAPPTSTTQNMHSEDIVHVKSSPAKSTLKQPTSRIPRIGTKPYARSDPTIIKKATVTTADASKPLSKAVDSAAIARRNARETMKGLTASTSTRSKPVATTSITTTLKRKREGEGASPVKPRVIMLRQVPPLPTPPIEKLSISQSTGLPATAPTKGKKSSTAQPLMRIRRVIDPPPTVVVDTAPPRKSPPQSDPVLLVKNSTPSPTESMLPAIHSAPSNQQASPELAPGSPMNEDASEQPAQRVHQAIEDSSPANKLDTTEDATRAGGLRRTTRSRRSTAVSQDVFTEGSSRAGSTRRKAPAFHFDDVFSGMSMTALKDLTVSNTVKNQRYVAAKLETEVIRKEGTRPESPAVKIRTIVQRQQEERERERAERANRRARRSGEDIPSSDMDPLNSAAHSGDSMSEDEFGQSPVRHTRGAGEDDDYVTPETFRHMKALRLFSDATGDQEPEPMRRRVKWDRGLFTTVYLDEVKLGTRQPLKENRALKGILAPTAKAIRLDTLGNHPHAELPLGDIVQENITVKKIVYDSDVVAAVAEVAAAARSTRSKSKKK